LPEKISTANAISRRAFLEGCAATALAASPATRILAAQAPAMHNSAAQSVLPLNGDWFFGGKLVPNATDPAFNDAGFARITLPQSAAPLSWQGWDPASWEDQWIYRRHFSLPTEWREMRLFLHFDRIMESATPVLNGHALEPHLGGFLPFEREITGLVHAENNVLAVIVDGRWLNVPPSGSPRGPASVDYLLPAGITGSVELRAVPSTFIREFYAKPVNVLSTRPRVEIACTVDAAGTLPARVRLSAALKKDGRTVATASEDAQIEKPTQEISLTLDRLTDIDLWDCDHPHLYTVEITLHRDEKPIHTAASRIGFRELRWELDGFYLNGKRIQLFGLDRHELYPYVGFAAPPRLLRRDAEILRRRFNCNAVRCSHYPQSEAFLDACDELGLLVWEELPGWQYIGDESFCDLAVRDVEQMIRRDRNHPSIFVWGVRINESHNDPALYAKTRTLAHSLDSTRATTGTMTPSSRKNWQSEWNQDVFAFDDYHADPIGSVGILPPVEGHPYMIAEAVGQYNYRSGRGFDVRYRRAGDIVQQTDQAVYHAQAHSRAANYPRIAGVIAWCAFDYASIMNDYKAVKCPGIADVFRIGKLGAAFYLAQVDPSVRAVIEPDFYWDFGPQTPSGPGEHAAIFSNCDRLDLFIDGKPRATLHPDKENYPHLKYPPFFVDLELDGVARPELRIDGYVGGKHILSRSFSSDPAHDLLSLTVEDATIHPDGSDATRIVFAIVDKFGAPRAYAGGTVKLKLEGPGTLVGDNPFDLADNGGAGAVYVHSIAGKTGRVRIHAEHSSLGRKSVEIAVA